MLKAFSVFIAFSATMPQTLDKQNITDLSTQLTLANQYTLGTGGKPIDPKEAFKWYLKAAKQGHVGAQINVSALYTHGQGVDVDLTEAARWMARAADAGNSQAQLYLGVMYLNGTGVQLNKETAYKLFESAASQGNKIAQYNVGALNYHNGVASDYKVAFKWFLKSAKQGYVNAQFNIFKMYKNGEGVIKNSDKAIEWLELAAKNGDTIAQYEMGELYLIGKVLPKDIEKSHEWFLMAAQQGDPDAEFEVSINYGDPDSKFYNPKEALRLIKKLATAGHIEGLDSMGDVYWFGAFDVEVDYQKSYIWNSLAVAMGLDRAIKDRDAAYGKLTAAQISAAKVVIANKLSDFETKYVKQNR